VYAKVPLFGDFVFAIRLRSCENALHRLWWASEFQLLTRDQPEDTG
jgi:hypothetical protein